MFDTTVNCSEITMVLQTSIFTTWQKKIVLMLKKLKVSFLYHNRVFIAKIHEYNIFLMNRVLLQIIGHVERITILKDTIKAFEK